MGASARNRSCQSAGERSNPLRLTAVHRRQGRSFDGIRVAWQDRPEMPDRLSAQGQWAARTRDTGWSDIERGAE